MMSRGGVVRWGRGLSIALSLLLPRAGAGEDAPAKRQPTFEDLLVQGGWLEDQRQNRQAALIYHRASVLALRGGRKADEAWARARECRALWGAGDQDGALPVCREALVMAQGAPSEKAEAEAEKGLGLLDLSRGDYMSAERRLHRAAGLASALHEDEILISALNNLSVAALDQARVDEAIDYSSRALRASEAFARTSVRMRFAVPYNLAKAFEAAGDEESARVWLDRAARSAAETGFGGGLHHVLMESAALLLRAGDLDGASAYYERAIAWNQATPDLEEDVALARQGHAATLEARGRTEEALAEYEEALAVLAKPGRQALSVLPRISVGRCLNALGRFDAAEKQLGLAESMAHRMGLRVAEELARLERARGIEGRKRPEAERELAGSAARLAAMGLHSDAARAHVEAARVAERAGERARALEWTLRALAEIERVRANLPAELRWRFLETAHETYATAYRLHMRAAGPGEAPQVVPAFETIERERSRDLADAARVSRVSAPGREDARDPERRLARIQVDLLTELPAQRREALLREQSDAERDLLLREKGSTRKGFRELAGRAVDHLEALAPGEALLTYTLDEPASLFIVTRAGVQGVRLPANPALSDQASFFATLLAQGDAARARPAGDALARTLLAPALPLLPPSTRGLVIAATGDLADVPFGALPHPRDGKPLLDHYQVSYVPSLKFLAALREAPAPKGQGALVLADPGGGAINSPAARGPALGPLPHAREEGREVAAYFPSHLLLEGAAATPRAVFAQGSKRSALHFAAHAVIDRQAPMNSALVLSPESASRTGWMTAREIYALDLDTALVTLSSCRSSTGPRTRASTAPSLARAFLYTGSRAVVAGLWDADDAATRELMDTFYRELSEGQAVGAALTFAQRALARSRNPAHWAGFQVIGDPSTRLNGMARQRGWGWTWGLTLAAMAAAGVAMAGSLRKLRP